MLRYILLGIGAVLVLAVTSCGVEIVDTGHTGVKKELGKVVESPFPPGLYFTNPLTTSVTSMDNRTQRYDAEANTYTKDVQQADVNYAVNYNLLPANTVKVYSEVGKDYENVLIPQIVSGQLKNVIGQWNASELVSNRQDAAEKIEAAIAAQLTPLGIKISGFQLTNIKFHKEFEDAVEAKVVAIQRADEAKNQTVQVQEQANQTVISAKAAAEAMKIKTEALEKNQGLTAYEAVQKWNGVLPTMVTGDAAQMLLNLGASK